MLAAILLIIAAVALVAGLVLTVVGLRGRRVDDHSVCRKCGRDLHGLDNVDRCPECGVRLADEPPRIGNRVRRRNLVAAGVLLGFPAVLWLGGLAAVTLSGLETMSYKPVWLLAMEAGGGNGPAAVAELRKRYDAGELSPEETAELIERFLDDQGDLEQEWDRPKGTFIEHVAVAGGMTPEQWQRYVEQGAGPAMRVRPRVRAGEALPISFSLSSTRFAGAASPFAAGRGIALRLEALQDGQSLSHAVAFLWVEAPAGIRLNESLPIPLSASGEEVALALNVAETWPPGSDPFASNATRTRPSTIVQRVLETVEVVPSDEPTAEAVESTALSQLFATRMRLTPIHVDRRKGLGKRVEITRDRAPGAAPRLQFLISSSGDPPNPLPMAVAAEVWVEWDIGHRNYLADVAIGRGMSGASVGGSMPPDFDAKTITIRLVPALEVAESTPDIVEYWDREWVWEDVEVVWPQE